jgi:hypothetical protein
VIIFAVLAIAAGIIWHESVHTIRNQRPLAGPNIDVSPDLQPQSEASFSIDPRNPKELFGATNDASRETLRLHTSTDGGKTWPGTDGPVVAGGACAHGNPLTAIDRTGRQYLAFLAGTFCGDTLTPYLVVTSRDSTGGAWAPLVRVVPSAWKFGFDDWPALALDEQTGRLYLVWTRSLSAAKAELVLSSSIDHGRTWTAPREVSAALVHPHLATISVAPDGDLYVGGIDAKLGVWVARSTDHGATFGAPQRAAQLLANPASQCALAAASPLATEESTCFGPNPTVLAGQNQVIVVYADAGANRTFDINAAVLDRDLKPLTRVEVNPKDTSATQQLFPAAALDPVTGIAWACWFDTTFDPHGHRAWFTCSASRTGRTWSPPLAASSAPTAPPDLFGAAAKLGFTPDVVARAGVAHAFWPDGRIIDNSFDIFTVAIPQGRALGG